jgi:hypothetical protein
MSDPTVAAEAVEFDDADELLYERIMELSGDGENQHEYSPPAPVPGAGAIERGRLWKLGPSASTTMRIEPEYFAGGLCDNCLMPFGARTALPLVVAPLAGTATAATVTVEGAGVGNGPRLTIVSEQLLEVFTVEERAAFEWRSVRGASAGQSYFELIPRHPTAPNVSPIGIPTQFGRCDTCGFMWTAPQRGAGRPDWYVSEADLSSTAPTIYAVRQPAYATLAITDSRWRTLVGRRELKGIKGSPIAIIAAEAVQRPTSFVPRERAKRSW